jgi:hypothetical protein
VFDTTEIRWILPGPLPNDVAAWFVADGAVTFEEERVDRYVASGSPAMGIKLRGRRTLEIKIRRGVDGPVRLRPDLAARGEPWRKWQATSAVEAAVLTGHRWVDVNKIVLTRRYLVGKGGEPVVARVRPPDAAGCDVELAAIRVDEHESWTFAFEAFGPHESQRGALVATAEVFPPPADIAAGARSGQEASYPAWLESRAVAATAWSGWGGYAVIGRNR